MDEIDTSTIVTDEAIMAEEGRRLRDLEITVPVTWDTNPKTREQLDRMTLEMHNQVVAAKRRAKLRKRLARRGK